ncbi:hypothetical protein KZX46_10505 [Polymorphobacter sp. PAMC 29334]|uniref:DUF6882 domain-containing protein n=1 Tax=Polymorphobacter sp. PAMC 29334 TaxID=2862331 RepID=UPI001C778E6D|nr:DUF6882 domain-containing protein [Polymorphobacter sp. PAMC 29334]QYE36314.1 hypothetical protein KZX46_10505 [Polymorphobacter sp. PAMC 29334]
MTVRSYQELVDSATAGLKQKRGIMHDTYGLDRAKGWDYDVKHAQPNFVIWGDEEQPLLYAETLEVGTFLPAHSTWKWGWCNPSIPSEQQEKLAVLRELAEITGQELFRLDQPFVISREDASGLLAMAVQHLDAQGGYAAKIVNMDGQSLDAHIAYTAVAGPG